VYRICESCDKALNIMTARLSAPRMLYTAPISQLSFNKLTNFTQVALPLLSSLSRTPTFRSLSSTETPPAFAVGIPAIPLSTSLVCTISSELPVMVADLPRSPMSLPLTVRVPLLRRVRSPLLSASPTYSSPPTLPSTLARPISSSLPLTLPPSTVVLVPAAPLI
jgi:hypothetical protein